jgi:long-chain acyl-CoA synthetase
MLRVFNSIGDLLLETIKEHGDRPYLLWRDEVGQKIQRTFREVFEWSGSIAVALDEIGIQKGDRLAIFSETRAEWIVADLAVLGLGAITTTIYPSVTAAQVQYIVDNSGSRVLFVDDKENLKKTLEQWDQMPSLEQIFFFDKLTDKDLFDLGAPKEKVRSLSWLELKGRELLKNNAGFFEAKIRQVEEEDLASIIYTSGTTGTPKGVMLTHRNFLSNAITSSEIIRKMDPSVPPYEQNALTFMPLSHSYCRTCEEFVAIYNGATLCLAGGRSPAIIETGFKVFHPSLMAGIPYVYSKIYQTIFNKINKYPAGMQKLFYKALDFGKKYNNLIASGQKPSLNWRVRHWLDNKLVYKQVQEQLGGRLMAFVSGSARLPTEIVETFWALGVRILDGYGLTEATPVTHAQRVLENSDFRPNWPAGKRIHPIAKLGSVGPPLEFPGNPYPNVEARTAEDGELLIKGPNVMKGYWNKPEETTEALDEEGWLHTGDLGRIDEDGYLYITGRKKLIIKLMTGKMVAPALVEDVLVLSPFILQVVLVGSEEKYLTAFLVPNQKAVKDFADEQGINYGSYQDLLQNEQILEKIKTEILKQSKDLSAYETVKKFAVFAQEFNEDEGYLTPTLKIKRDRVLADFEDIVKELYKTDKDWVIVDRRLVDFHNLTIPG